MSRALITKPPLGVQLDRTHPLTVGLQDCLLFNEGAGARYTNLVNPTFDGAVNGSVQRVNTPAGLGAYSTGGAGVDVPNHYNPGAGNFTARVVFIPRSFTGPFTTIFCKAVGSSDRQLAYFCDGSGNNSACCAGGAITASTAPVNTPLGVVSDLVMLRRGSIISFYLNGVFRGTVTLANTAGTGAPLTFGRSQSAGGTDADCIYLEGQVWTRALSDADVASLHVNPYQMYGAPLWQRAWLRSGTAAATLFRRNLYLRSGSRGVMR